MKKYLPIIIIPVIILILTGIVLLRSDEDNWICEKGDWVKHGNPTSPKPDTPCGKSITKPQKAITEPEKVVRDFYARYLKNDDRMTQLRDSVVLTEGFKQKIAGILLDSSDKGGYDPMFLTRDDPESISVTDAVIDDDIARVYVTEHFTQTNKDILVALQKQESTWIITDVLEAEARISDYTTTKKVTVYFSNSIKNIDSADCSLVYGVERLVGKTDGNEAILRQLFMGPTMLERDNGYYSFFSKETDGMVISVKVMGETAYINLKDIRSEIPNASSSCGSQSLLAQMDRTLKENGKITRTVYAINGDPKKFYEWLQLGCSADNEYCSTEPFR